MRCCTASLSAKFQFVHMCHFYLLLLVSCNRLHYVHTVKLGIWQCGSSKVTEKKIVHVGG